MEAVRLKRGRERDIKFDVTECVCFRPRCFVICINCGFRIFGRVRRFCPSHPGRIFLLDLTMCPTCKAYASLLCEFDKTL